MYIKMYFVILLVVLGACNNNEVTKADVNHASVKIKITGEAQGTYYAITYFDDQQRNLKNEIEALLNKFDKSASNYLPSSIISKVNRNEDVDLDDIFLGNYNLAMRISKETNGDFDITVRPLVQAWGFGSVKSQDMDSAMVDSIMDFVGFNKILINDNKVIKEDSRLQLDFDAIAQGYAVDYISDFLKEIGIEHYLVDIGGEMYASKSKTDSTHWKVGIENPKDNAAYGENLTAFVFLKEKGMATSGNYRKFYIKDGIKYVHTINPHSGFPIASRLLSVTVIAKTTAEADAYATALMVMGLSKTKKFLANHSELQGYLIYSDDDGEFLTYFTQNFFETAEMLPK